MLNQLNLMGRLTKDPEIQITENGVKIARITIACTKEIRNKEDGKYGTNYFKIKCWQGIAKLVEDYLKKGMLVIVSGRLENNSYINKDGQKIEENEIIGERVFFVSSVNRTTAAVEDEEEILKDLE